MKPQVVAELSRAEKALQAAQLLHDNHLFEDAISRSYYAVLHAAKAALLTQETIAESHAGVRRIFGQKLVRPGLIEKEWAAILSSEQDQRTIADYDALATWDEDAAAHLIADARAFVQRIREYLATVDSSGDSSLNG